MSTSSASAEKITEVLQAQVSALKAQTTIMEKIAAGIFKLSGKNHDENTPTRDARKEQRIGEKSKNEVFETFKEQFRKREDVASLSVSEIEAKALKTWKSMNQMQKKPYFKMKAMVSDPNKQKTQMEIPHKTAKRKKKALEEPSETERAQSKLRFSSPAKKPKVKKDADIAKTNDKITSLKMTGVLQAGIRPGLSLDGLKRSSLPEKRSIDILKNDNSIDKDDIGLESSIMEDEDEHSNAESDSSEEETSTRVEVI
jgi:hypothetical protein